MDEVGIEIIRKYPHDPYLVGLQANMIITASDGEYQGKLGAYIPDSEIERISKPLVTFVDKFPNKFSYEKNSSLDDESVKSYFNLTILSDKQGECVITITLKRYDGWTEFKQECLFSIRVEPWAIHRLGELLKKYSTAKYSFLKWSLNADEDLLVENEQSA
jgi:hypothetical protein